MLGRFFRRKPPADPAEEPWTPGPGWRPYFLPFGGFDAESFKHREVEVIREGWDGPVSISSLSQHANAVGLWWRPMAPMIDVTPQMAKLEAKN